MDLGDTIFFFFQAEDGIRDVAVTGVQTCALPISQGHTMPTARLTTIVFTWRNFTPRYPESRNSWLNASACGFAIDYEECSVRWHDAVGRRLLERSEERRVGKESSSRG